MVTASRRHLTERYASGVDRLLWDTEKRLIPDLDAIKSVTEAMASGQAEALDIGAALVLVQAARLALDRLGWACSTRRSRRSWNCRTRRLRPNGTGGSRRGGHCRRWKRSYRIRGEARVLGLRDSIRGCDFVNAGARPGGLFATRSRIRLPPGSGRGASYR